MQKKVGNTILQDLRVMDNVEIDGQTGTPSYRDAATHLKREEEQRARAKRLNCSMVQNKKNRKNSHLIIFCRGSELSEQASK